MECLDHYHDQNLDHYCRHDRSVMCLDLHRPLVVCRLDQYLYQYLDHCLL